MKHRYKCKQGSGDNDFDPRVGCEDCQKDFETDSSYCGNCWKVVTNKVFLAKKSPHVTGKCRERHVIPRSIFQRTVDKKLPYPFPDGFHTPLDQDHLIPYQWLKLDGSPLIEQSTQTETEETAGEQQVKVVEVFPGPGFTVTDADGINVHGWYATRAQADRAIELMEEQNRLLRQLVG